MCVFVGVVFSRCYAIRSVYEVPCLRLRPNTFSARCFFFFFGCFETEGPLALITQLWKTRREETLKSQTVVPMRFSHLTRFSRAIVPLLICVYVVLTSSEDPTKYLLLQQLCAIHDAKGNLDRVSTKQHFQPLYLKPPVKNRGREIKAVMQRQTPGWVVVTNLGKLRLTY